MLLCCSGSTYTVDLDRVIRVQQGQLTSKFIKHKWEFSELGEKLSFSIIYDDFSTSLDLVTSCKSDFDIWFNGLNNILKKKRFNDLALSPFTRYLKLLW